ncbi:hypothetical protein VSR68_42190 [Paraburkholderia phymatum]|uniref:hypothetical protein n=1 Tax=Paraburkholderia phymatum TaxID=148447 RepID=UPI003173EFE7
MSTKSCASYRGCEIEVLVTPAQWHAFGGICRRYRVSWIVSSPGNPGQVVASFPEQFDFLAEQEAFKYGEGRAHTFIDSILSTPLQRRIAGDSSEHADEAPTA